MDVLNEHTVYMFTEYMFELTVLYVCTYILYCMYVHTYRTLCNCTHILYVVYIRLENMRIKRIKNFLISGNAFSPDVRWVEEL